MVGGAAAAVGKAVRHAAGVKASAGAGHRTPGGGGGGGGGGRVGAGATPSRSGAGGGKVSVVGPLICRPPQHPTNVPRVLS